jgi:hypothetical protein
MRRRTFTPDMAGRKPVIDIHALEVIRGKLPHRALHLVLDWAEFHQQELLEDWRLCENNQQPTPIAPLP